MKHSWRIRYLPYLFGIVAAIPTLANDKAKDLRENCMNIQMFGWRIVQRLDSGKYEVITREGTNFCGNAPGSICMPIEPVRAVLVTNGDKFRSEGLIRLPVWVENTDKTPETIEMPLDNGFKKSFRVVRESATCTAYGERLATERESLRNQEEEAQRKIAAQEIEAKKHKAKARSVERKKERKEQEKVEDLWK